MNNTVTKEEVLANMQTIICRTVIEFGKPTTYVTVRMKNGFTLRESTTCVDPANYNEEIGKKICLKRIEEKIWNLLGYVLQENLTFPQNPSSYSPSPSEANEKMVSIPKQKYNNLIKRSKRLKKIEEAELLKELEEFFAQVLGRGVCIATIVRDHGENKG